LYATFRVLARVEVGKPITPFGRGRIDDSDSFEAFQISSILQPGTFSMVTFRFRGGGVCPGGILALSQRVSN
jgi:hypothetical protein